MADPPGIGISKISKDVKKIVRRFFSAIAFGCRMQKPVIKLVKFSHWDMALGCGPGSRKHAPLPQSRLPVLFEMSNCRYIAGLFFGLWPGAGLHIAGLGWAYILPKCCTIRALARGAELLFLFARILQGGAFCMGARSQGGLGPHLDYMAAVTSPPLQKRS